MRFRILFLIALALALGTAQTSFADTSAASSGASSCTNSAGSPTAVDFGFPYGIVLYTAYTCSLYDDASTYTIDLTPLLTQDGANLYDNLVGAGYFTVINGDPNAISAGDTDDAALYNESLWDTVLYFPGDQDAGTASDTLTVYEAGDFPSAATVQTFDENLYGAGADSEFFIEAAGPETVYTPYPNEYDIYGASEPGSMPLLAIGLAMLAGLIAVRRRAAQQPA